MQRTGSTRRTDVQYNTIQKRRQDSENKLRLLSIWLLCCRFWPMHSPFTSMLHSLPVSPCCRFPCFVNLKFFATFCPAPTCSLHGAPPQRVSSRTPAPLSSGKKISPWLLGVAERAPHLLQFFGPAPFTPNPTGVQPTPHPRVQDSLLRRRTRTYTRKYQPAYSAFMAHTSNVHMMMQNVPCAFRRLNSSHRFSTLCLAPIKGHDLCGACEVWGAAGDRGTDSPSISPSPSASGNGRGCLGFFGMP